MGGGGGNSGPTLQQKQLETQQALTTANLNLEENAQRKSILSSMLGTRVFRGSALSRSVRGNTPGGEPQATGPSRAQLTTGASLFLPRSSSLLDSQLASASGATPAGGTGASGVNAAAGGVRGFGSGAGAIPRIGIR